MCLERCTCQALAVVTKKWKDLFQIDEKNFDTYI